MVSANALGAERVLAFMDEYGVDDLAPLATVVQGRSERAMRDALAALPDGTWHTDITNNPLGETLRYPLALTITGDRLVLDFADAPPQARMAASTA